MARPVTSEADKDQRVGKMAKLPENYGYLMGFVDGDSEEGGAGGKKSAVGKKEVYARLAKAVRFDDGKREFWLEKSTGMRRRTGIPVWYRKPVRFQLSTSDGQNAVSQRYLDDEPGSWALYHAGDFVVAPDTEEHGQGRPVRVKFSMAQIDCTHTKGGLCVDSVLVYPRGFRTERVVDAQR
ncbi:hypothetical protein TRIUR3_15841 [Triticum urartu]|uniref:Uncharacterized protein n=1 Tax=Triticum urartu TaxID=4572 RepID=M8A8I8_TRIUA|nr:hypothetical protein TRIUR3_15841 [Triticum urartu]